MAYFQRHLNRITLLAALAIASWATPAVSLAQPPPVKPPVVFRTLALGMSTGTDILYDYKEKPVIVTAGGSAFSSPYSLPENRQLQFYRVLPPVPPEKTPRRQILADVNVGAGDGPFLLFMIIDPDKPTELQVKVVHDSWDEHPVQTMRMFNFSRRKTLLKITDTPFELSTAESRLFPYAAGTQIWMQAATFEEGRWEVRVSGPQLTLPKTRATVVLLDQPPTIEFPNAKDLLVRNFVDFEPAKPTQ